MEVWRFPMTATIYIVDDDAEICTTLKAVVADDGFDVACFCCGDDFLERMRTDPPACVLLDINMPERTGIDILQELTELNFSAPVFVMSAGGDIRTCVSAMKLGAHDYIEKPFGADAVLGRIRTAIGRPSEDGNGGEQSRCTDCLTGREREVLQEILRGASNKEAGRSLGISPRTVEAHRAHILAKLGARNTADLIRIAMSR